MMEESEFYIILILIPLVYAIQTSASTASWKYDYKALGQLLIDVSSN